MKRSLMLKYIKDLIEKELKDENNFNASANLSNEILDMIESQGMSPPKIGGYYTISPIHGETYYQKAQWEWETE